MMTDITLSVEQEMKTEAEKIFANHGMTLAEAIKIFLRESILEYGMPFSPGRPSFNKETIEAIQETEDILSGKIHAKKYNSVSEMLAEIVAEDEEDA